MGSLLIVTGPPGAGKTTVSLRLANRFSRSVLLEGDAFFAFLASGAIQPWLPESNHQNEIVTEAAALATGRFVTDYDTIFDGVIGPWFLRTFVKAAGLSTVDYAILLPPVETCVERVRTRTGHGFTDEATTRKMHTEFASAAIDPRHVLDKHPPEQEDVVDGIVHLQSEGLLRYDLQSRSYVL